MSYRRLARTDAVAAVLFATLTSTGPAPAEAGSPRQITQATEAAREVALIESATGTLVWDSGVERTIELPGGAWVNRLAALDLGWVAAGSRLSGAARDLVLLQDDGSGRVAAQPLPDHDAFDLAAGSAELPNRHGAVPIVESGKLAGIAWLEGRAADRLNVRAARFGARSWAPTESISTDPGNGQVALTGTALDGGGWLLAWSRDDDGVSRTYWSLHRPGEAWTAPQPIEPGAGAQDVTPALVRVAGGALAAWSRLDGGVYRIHLARFDGERWIDTGFRGPAGSLYPTFRRTAEGALLLHRVGAAAWSVVEIGSGGDALRQATIAGGSAGSTPGERPLVSIDSDRPAFLWPLDGELALDRRTEAAWRPIDRVTPATEPQP